MWILIVGGRENHIMHSFEILLDSKIQHIVIPEKFRKEEVLWEQLFIVL